MKFNIFPITKLRKEHLFDFVVRSKILLYKLDMLIRLKKKNMNFLP